MPTTPSGAITGAPFATPSSEPRAIRSVCECGEAPTATTRASIRRAGACLSTRSEEHTSELQSRLHLVCRLLLEKKTYHTDITDFIVWRTTGGVEVREVA